MGTFLRGVLSGGTRLLVDNTIGRGGDGDDQPVSRRRRVHSARKHESTDGETMSSDESNGGALSSSYDSYYDEYDDDDEYYDYYFDGEESTLGGRY